VKTLIFGAGPLGTLYAHILHKAGKDVSILARNQRYEFIKENGIVLVDEFTGNHTASPVKVVGAIAEDDAYDLAIVLIRKNKLPPVFQALSFCHGIENILFMGNNALGFDAYLANLPKHKVLFGFPVCGRQPAGTGCSFRRSGKAEQKADARHHRRTGWGSHRTNKADRIIPDEWRHTSQRRRGYRRLAEIPRRLRSTDPICPLQTRLQ